MVLSCLGPELTRNIKVADKSPSVKSLFAEFGVRMVALLLDVFAVLSLILVLETHVLSAVDVTMPDGRIGPFLFFVLYFGSFWASPLRATPGQLLLGMRVVDASAERLRPQWAFARSAAFVLLFAGTYLLFEIPARPLTVAVGIAALAGAFLAAVTPNRQAAHDLIARSMVVNARSLRAAERRDQLLEHVANEEGATYRRRRPTILSIAIDVAVLAFPVFLMTIVAQTQHDRDRRARTSYAYGETSELVSAVADYYLEHHAWPLPESVLGVPTRADYPDGGYYELEDDGVIRIKFTVLPDLMAGSIVRKPSAQSDGVIWTCRIEGDIPLAKLPASCRD